MKETFFLAVVVVVMIKKCLWLSERSSLFPSDTIRVIDTEVLVAGIKRYNNIYRFY